MGGGGGEDKINVTGRKQRERVSNSKHRCDNARGQVRAREHRGHNSPPQGGGGGE